MLLKMVGSKRGFFVVFIALNLTILSPHSYIILKDNKNASGMVVQNAL